MAVSYTHLDVYKRQGYYDAYYLKALRVKALIKKAFDDAFAKYDVILGPAAPVSYTHLTAHYKMQVAQSKII